MTHGPAPQVGFAKSKLPEDYAPAAKCRHPLEAYCFLVADQGEEIALITLDLIWLFPHENEWLRSELSNRVGLTVENTLLHATHSHSTPWKTVGDPPVFDSFPDCLHQLIDDARATLQPATISYGKTDVGHSLSTNRRGHTGEELGLQSFWFGYRYDAESDHADASPLINDLKARWRGHPPDYTPGEQPILFDGPVDPWVHALSFQTADGHILGTIVAFAAHPHLTSCLSPKLYDSDFIGATRREMESVTKAPCMYLLPPCSHLVPKEKVEYIADLPNAPKPPYLGPGGAYKPATQEEVLNESKRIGKAIAQAALSALQSAEHNQLSSVQLRNTTEAIPLDRTLPRTAEEAEAQKPEWITQYEAALANGAPLSEIQPIARQLNWLDWSGNYSDALNATDIESGTKEMPLSRLALNELDLLFMHSEIALDTAQQIEAEHPQRTLLNVSNTNGYIGYYPTPKMIDEGGFEGLSTIVAKNAEQNLRQTIRQLLGD